MGGWVEGHTGWVKKERELGRWWFAVDRVSLGHIPESRHTKHTKSAPVFLYLLVSLLWLTFFLAQTYREGGLCVKARPFSKQGVNTVLRYFLFFLHWTKNKNLSKMHTSRSKSDNTYKKKKKNRTSLIDPIGFVISDTQSGQHIHRKQHKHLRSAAKVLTRERGSTSFLCLSCTLWTITFIFSSWGDHKVGPLVSVAYLRHITFNVHSQEKRTRKKLHLECKFDTSFGLSFQFGPHILGRMNSFLNIQNHLSNPLSWSMTWHQCYNHLMHTIFLKVSCL